MGSAGPLATRMVFWGAQDGICLCSGYSAVPGRELGVGVQAREALEPRTRSAAHFLCPCRGAGAHCAFSQIAATLAVVFLAWIPHRVIWIL